MASPAWRRLAMNEAILSPTIASISEFSNGSNYRRFLRPIRQYSSVLALPAKRDFTNGAKSL